MGENDIEQRTVIVLNKRYEIGRLLNALGHTVFGLAGSALNEADLSIQQYRDADGGPYPFISYHPVIVLKADNGNQLRRFRQDIEAAGLPAAVFVHTMFEGGTPAQLEATAKTAAEDLDYVAVATFGATEVVKPLAKKFRLFT